MSKEKPATKTCKHCRTEIPYDAKVCPNCRKKQGGIVRWIVIAVVVLLVIAAIAGGSGSGDADRGTDSNPKKSDTSAVSDSAADETDKASADNSSEDGSVDSDAAGETADASDTIFHVGDVVETSNLNITYVSAGQYVSDNEFLQPKEGYVYCRAEFEFENVGSSDEFVTLYDFDCYADGYAADALYAVEDALSATISSGNKAKGAVYFEVPADAQEIILEYETNYWTEDKVKFEITK